MRFQTIAPSKPPRITFGSTILISIIPLPTVLATLMPTVKSAAKLKNAAQTTAWIGLSTRVPTMVAMEFAESWNPLMKSNANAIATIAMMYATTSGVLEGDGLKRMDDGHAAVRRVLKLVVDLLPADHVEWIRRPPEKRADGFMVDRVAFFFDALHFDRCRIDRRWLLDAGHAARDMIGGFDEQRREALGRVSHRADVQHFDASRSSVDQIDDVIQSCRQRMNVLPIEGRHEAAIDAGVDRSFVT